MAKQNKLTPILVAASLAIVGYVVWHRFSTPKAMSAGPAVAVVPEPGVDPHAAASATGMLGQHKIPPAQRPADADTMEETLSTVTAANKELRDIAQRQLDELAAMRKQTQAQQEREDDIVRRVTDRIAQQPQASPAAAVGTIVDNGLAAIQQMGGATGTVQSAIPSGLGYDGLPPAGAGKPAGPVAPVNLDGVALTKVIAPMGYSSAGAGPGGGGPMVRKTLGGKDAAAVPATLPAWADPGQSGATGAAKGLGVLEPAVPYFTLPENATLPEATAMTTLVGRVPIDGRVQDPMQFKLLVGRNNLAASGQYLPDDIAGIVVSGIAVGDMALSCTEGLIQSLTFIFDDGTIRTVSQRNNGASSGFGAGGIGAQSLAGTAKLGWISDAYGNPCLPGKFVTNAPAYLTDLVMAKGFSIAGAAVAAAETTTTQGVSALGSTSSTTVTGDKGRYVLGRTAGAGSDEIVTWLMKRLNNSFDAVVVKAGTQVAIHLDQEIAIDKAPQGRKLDYARGRSDLAQQTGVSHHGMD